MKTLFAITVDTEEQWLWEEGWPTGRPMVSHIQRLPQFQEICEQYGAAVTYFANYAVLNNVRSRAILDSLAKRSGVEIGMHIHPWNTPPIMDLRPVKPDESFLANLPTHLIEAKLENTYQLFRSHGFQPTSFRGGRYSSGGDVHEFLRNKRFVADTSVVPLTTWPDRGAPDYRHRSIEPVRHSPTEAYHKPMWEIPLTLGFSRRPYHLWQKVVEVLGTRSLRPLHLVGVAERLNFVRRVWLNFEDPLGEHMLSFLKILRKRKPACICFTLHSSSLEVGANGCYTRTERDRQQLLERVRQALELVTTWDEYRPATVSEIAQQLEAEYHASSRN